MGILSLVGRLGEGAAGAERVAEGASASAAGRGARTIGAGVAGGGIGAGLAKLISGALGTGTEDRSSPSSTGGTTGGGVTPSRAPNLTAISGGAKVSINETPFNSQDINASGSEVQFRQVTARKLNDIDRKIARLGNISIAIKQTLDRTDDMQRRMAMANQISDQENALRASAANTGLLNKISASNKNILGGLGLLAAGALLGGGFGKPKGPVNNSVANGGIMGGGLGAVTLDNFLVNLDKTIRTAARGVRSYMTPGVERVTEKVRRIVPEDRPGRMATRTRQIEEEVTRNVTKPSAISRDFESLMNGGVKKGFKQLGDIASNAYGSFTGAIKKVGAEISSSGVGAVAKSAMSTLKNAVSGKAAAGLESMVTFLRKFKQPGALDAAMAKIRGAVGKAKRVPKMGWLGKIIALLVVVDRLFPVVQAWVAGGQKPEEKIIKEFCIAVGQSVGLIAALMFSAVDIEALVAGGAAFGASIGTLICPIIGTIIGGAIGGAVGFAGAMVVDTIVAWCAAELGGDIGAFVYDFCTNPLTAIPKFIGRVGSAVMRVAKGVTSGKALGKLAEYSGFNLIAGLFGAKPKRAMGAGAAGSGASPGSSPSVSASGSPYSVTTPAQYAAAGAAAKIYQRLAPDLDFSKKFRELSPEEQNKYLDAMAANEGRKASNVNHRNNNPGNILWSAGDRKLLTKYGAVEGEHTNGLIYARFRSWQDGYECAREKLKSGRYANLTLAQDAQLWTTGRYAESGMTNADAVSSGAATGTAPGGGHGGNRMKHSDGTAGGGFNSARRPSDLQKGQSTSVGQDDYAKFRGTGKVDRSFRGKVDGVDSRTLDMFAKLQGETGLKIFVTSGVRPNGWHGSGPNNPHVVKKALDLGITGDQSSVADAAIRLGFTGIGGEGNHLHLDTSHNRLTAWGPDYAGSSTPAWLRKVIARHGGSTSGDSGMSEMSDASPGQGSPSSSPKSVKSSGSTAASTGTPSGRPDALTSDAPRSSMPPKLPNVRAQNMSRQYGIPDPKAAKNESDDYSVYFNANEPAFGVPLCSV